MNTPRTPFLLILLATLLMSSAPSHAESFEIPRVEGLTIDGQAGDWGESGFRASLQASPDGRTIRPHDLNGMARIAWSDEGLHVLIEVTDDVAMEYDRVDRLYRKDSVELFVSDSPGSSNRYQVYLSSGADAEYGSLRTHVNDHRSPEIREHQEAITITARSMVLPEGYRIEVLLPWSNLGMESPPEHAVGFQIYLNDADSPEGYPGEWIRFSWHPGGMSGSDAGQVNDLYLSDEASSPDAFAVRQSIYVERGYSKVTVIAPAARAGLPVHLHHGGAGQAVGTLVESNGRATLHFRAPLPEPGALRGETLVAFGDAAKVLDFGDLERARILTAAAMKVVFAPYCFSGTTLPGCDFASPLEAEALIGPYRIEVAYYDAHYNAVEEATVPGRYGAVVDIIPESGARPMRRLRTLYRQPGTIDGFWWWPFPSFGGSLELPEGLGIERDVVLSAEKDIILQTERLWRDAGASNAKQAVLLAGLSEILPGEEVDFWSDAISRDFEWWAGMKRRLYDLEARFPAGFVCPVETDGAPAPVLREGTALEAGMKADAREVIDALCREWVEESGEPFTICLARRGVIVHHAAYGERDGVAMTLETQSWLASITKLLGGACVMMLVDQGIVGLDDPISNYLPMFEDVRTEPLITVRDVFRHTSGLPEIWPAMVTDLEFVMAEAASLAKVQSFWSYNTATSELGGRVVEAASGKALLRFYQNHLFGPLGCDNIHARGSGGDAFSAAIDLVRIGQMLLNRGAYGKMRFFSEGTFEKMLPTSLAGLPEEPRPWGREYWGIGVALMGAEYGQEDGPYVPFGPRAFGHGAASSSTFLVDPEREVVLVVARNRGGPKFREYARRLSQEIVALCSGD